MHVKKAPLFFILFFGLVAGASAQFTVSSFETPSIKEFILIDGSVPSLVIAENPSTPVVTRGYSGGIDKGSPGDDQAFYLASPRDKRWHGGTVNPESISLSFSLAPDANQCEIEVGYFEGGSQTRHFAIFLNDTRIHTFRLPQGTFGSQEKKLKEIRLNIDFTSKTNNQGPHTLRITQTDWWGVTLIDAIQIRGKGIRLLDPNTGKMLSSAEIKEESFSSLPRLPKNFSLPKECIALDCGSEESMVWSEGGFEALTPKTIYKEGARFGWIGNRSVLSGKVVQGSWDILRSDCISMNFTEGEGPVLKINVPSGKYRVFLIAGGVANAKRFLVQIGDKTLNTNFIGSKDNVLNRTAIIHRTVECNVGSNGLSISFPDKYAILNGLVIYPVSLIEKVEPQLTHLIEEYYLPACIEVKKAVLSEAEKKSLEGKLEELVDTADEEHREGIFTPSKTDLAKGYTPFTNLWFRLIFPDSTPFQEELSSSIQIFATPGEYEPFTCSLRTHKALTGVRAECNGFKDAKGRKIISASSCPIFTVSYMKGSVTTRPNGQYKIQPKFLMPHTPESLAADFTREYWCTVHVPSNTPSGIYTGTFTIYADNAPSTDIKVSLEVLPFTLPPVTDRFVGLYWGDHVWPVNEKECVDQHFADMAAHGINATTSYGDGARFFLDEKGNLNADFSRMREIMKLRKKHGLIGPVPNTGASAGTITRLGFKQETPEFEKAYIEMVRMIAEEGKKEEWPEVLFYPLDEPNYQRFATIGGYLCRLIHKVPGARTYITTYPENMNAARKVDSELDTWLDIPCLSRHTEEDIKTLKEQNKPYFYYSGAYSGAPYSPRYTNGFSFWRSGATAMYYWAYSWTKGNGFFDLDNDERETGVVACAPDGGIISTLLWEGVREGMDDLKYAILLEKTVASLKPGSLKQEGEALLSRLRQSISLGATGRGKDLAALAKNPATIQNWRKEIALFLKKAL
ncbi:MAG: hypothetical protein WDA18_04470 [Candidatus Ratteibacteria bacterium]|jgi:hypothetical protein